jgi:hypothetical protein
MGEQDEPGPFAAQGAVTKHLGGLMAPLATLKDGGGVDGVYLWAMTGVTIRRVEAGKARTGTVGPKGKLL